MILYAIICIAHAQPISPPLFTYYINENLRITHVFFALAALDTVCRAGETDTEQVLIGCSSVPAY